MKATWTIDVTYQDSPSPGYEPTYAVKITDHEAGNSTAYWDASRYPEDTSGDGLHSLLDHVFEQLSESYGFEPDLTTITTETQKERGVTLTVTGEVEE